MFVTTVGASVTAVASGHITVFVPMIRLVNKRINSYGRAPDEVNSVQKQHELVTKRYNKHSRDHYIAPYLLGPVAYPAGLGPFMGLPGRNPYGPTQIFVPVSTCVAGYLRTPSETSTAHMQHMRK